MQSGKIINKQSVIGIEKSFIQAKLRTITRKTQIQEALELCSIRLNNEEGLIKVKIIRLQLVT